MIKTIAHRGISRLAPENTLPAYELGKKYGYYGLECDVHETLDQQFILMHDETVDRMTNGTGKVCDYTLEEIKQCLIQSGANVNSFPQLRVCLLQDYLRVCKQNGSTPVIEVKKIPNSSIKRLLEVINKWLDVKAVIIISFHEEILLEIRKLNPNIHLQWLAKLNKKNIDFCAKNKFNIDTKHIYVTEELVWKAHEKGVLVNAWTVNDGRVLRELCHMGVDFITTDYLLHQQRVRSLHSFTYNFTNKEEYKGLIHSNLKETLKLTLEKGNWRFCNQINGIEVYGKPLTKKLLNLVLFHLKQGDVVTISFWSYQVKKNPLHLTLRANEDLLMESKTIVEGDWEYVELQGIVTGIKKEEDCILEFHGDGEETHFFMKELNVKVDYL